MTTGIIIGRFQVPELTLGHKALLVKAYEQFDQVGILLGCSLHPNAENPLSFDCRADMLAEWDPVFIGKVEDCPGNNFEWSARVDQEVAYWASIKRLGTVTLVGGRNSFIPAYSGQYPTTEIPVWIGRSGTQVRTAIAGEVINSPEFRKGVIWTVINYGVK